MKQKKILSLALIFVFVLSVNANSNAVVAQTSYVKTNFDLSFFIPSGSSRDESYSLYIKQALAPLGINVRVFAKPWGQFVGDLTHESAEGKPWDITTVGFGGGSLTPSFIPLFHSQGYWGNAIMQLRDKDFQDYQLAQTGLNQTTDVDALIEAHDFELNLTRRFELLQELNDMYFTKLLWELPLVAATSKGAMWKGFGGPENELWDTKEGPVSSSFLGAKWVDADTPAQRTSNSSTMKYQTFDQKAFNLDTFQSIDVPMNSQTTWSQLASFAFSDRVNGPRPWAAWNWFTGDFGDTWENDTDPLNAEEGLTQYTFILRDDVFWHETTDMNGNFVAAEKVDGLDYNLTLRMYDMSDNNPLFNVNGVDSMKVLYDWEITTTIFPFDTITLRVPNSKRTPDDIGRFSGTIMQPLPHHLLGGDLTWLNSTATTPYNVTEPLSVDVTFNVWDSYQWNSFEKFAGNTAAGPYQLVDYGPNEFHSFAARDDFWFPNEWDTVTTHAANAADAEIVALETTYGVDLSLWGGSLTYDQDAYYFAYDEVSGNEAKPTSLNLGYIEYVVIDDQNAILLKFEAGDIDWIGTSAYGASTVADHVDNPGIVVKDRFPNSGTRNLYFNLLHPDLRKFNVRAAISFALDRDKLAAVHDGFGRAWFSIAYPNKQSGGIDWDLSQHPLDFDYGQARDLMRLEGYDAADSNAFIPTADVPAVDDIIDVLGVNIVSEIIGSEYLFLFAAFSMISVVLIRKRK